MKRSEGRHTLLFPLWIFVLTINPFVCLVDPHYLFCFRQSQHQVLPPPFPQAACSMFTFFVTKSSHRNKTKKSGKKKLDRAKSFLPKNSHRLNSCFCFLLHYFTKPFFFQKIMQNKKHEVTASQKKKAQSLVPIDIRTLHSLTNIKRLLFQRFLRTTFKNKSWKKNTFIFFGCCLNILVQSRIRPKFIAVP